METTNRLETNLRYLLWQKSLVTAYFHLPIVVLFWQDLGLSMLQIMILQAAFSMMTVVLELPSGIFADLRGRVSALRIAALFNFIGIVLYCRADGFLDLLVAEMFLAVFVAMQSGADSALLYDSLKGLKREDQYPRVLGNLIFVSTLVLGVTNVIGGFVGAEDLRWPIYLCVPFVFMALVISAGLVEPPAASPGPRSGNLGEQVADVIGTVRNDPGLKWLIAYAGVVLTFNQAGLWLYQPYFEITGIDVMFFGIIFALFQLVAAVSGKYYYLAKELLGEPRLLMSLIFITCGTSLLLGQFLFLFSFTLIFLHQIVRGFYKVVISDIINRRVDSNVRASILSVQNLVGRILTALVMPLIGLFADVYTIEQAFTLIGIMGLLSGVPVLWLCRKHRVC